MRRSWWGWGYVEEAASQAEIRELVDRVAQAMPQHDFADHPPPDPQALGLPVPRITAPASLSALCSADPVERAGHAHGKGFRDVAPTCKAASITSPISSRGRAPSRM